jgi:hypothetical protein
LGEAFGQLIIGLFGTLECCLVFFDLFEEFLSVCGGDTSGVGLTLESINSLLDVNDIITKSVGLVLGISKGFILFLLLFFVYFFKSLLAFLNFLGSIRF